MTPLRWKTKSRAELTAIRFEKWRGTEFRSSPAWQQKRGGNANPSDAQVRTASHGPPKNVTAESLSRGATKKKELTGGKRQKKWKLNGLPPTSNYQARKKFQGTFFGGG